MAEEPCPICGHTYEWDRKRENFVRVNGFVFGFCFGLLVGFGLMFWKFGGL